MDEERQQKAAPGSTTVDGDGTSKSPTPPPSENTEGRDGEEVKKTKIAPAGPHSKSTPDNELNPERRFLPV